MFQLWSAASSGAAIAWAVKLALPPMHPIYAAICILGAYGVTFFAASWMLKIPEATTFLRRLR